MSACSNNKQKASSIRLITYTLKTLCFVFAVHAVGTTTPPGEKSLASRSALSPAAAQQAADGLPRALLAQNVLFHRHNRDRDVEGNFDAGGVQLPKADDGPGFFGRRIRP